MNLKNLHLYHLVKATGISAPLVKAEHMFIETCQRYLWVSSTQLEVFGKGVEHYQGIRAYEFFLSVSTGLESAITGETDIFGQIKQVWAGYQKNPNTVIRDLSPWMQKIYEDVKDIRTSYLQNIGGNSYGSLVRKFLQPKVNEKILVLGAGQMAQAVVPFLEPAEIFCWNRSANNLTKLLQEMADLKVQNIVAIDSSNEQGAWENAKHVVLCIPHESLSDRQRASWWSQKKKFEQDGKILHLGCLKNQSSDIWKGIKNFYTLESLYEIQTSGTDLKNNQIMQARKACIERARLRSLGHSLTFPHGWEDLAVFV